MACSLKAVNRRELCYQLYHLNCSSATQAKGGLGERLATVRVTKRVESAVFRYLSIF